MGGVMALGLGPVSVVLVLPVNHTRVLPGMAPPTSLRDWCHLSLYSQVIPRWILYPSWKAWALQLVFFKVLIMFS